MQKLKILIADDHSVVRLGLKTILVSQYKDCEIEEVEDSKSLFASLNRKAYTHLILDLQLKDKNMLGVFTHIRYLFPKLQILIYSMSEEEVYARRLIQMGASCYLNKQANRAELIKTLQLFFQENMNNNIVNENLLERNSNLHNHNPFDRLSARESMVLESLLLGKRIKEISTELNLKSTTIATYKQRIFIKLGCTNVMDVKRLSENLELKY